MNYQIIITKLNKKDGAELPGCMSDGETQEEALKNGKLAIKAWIKTANIEKRNVPEAKGGKFI